MSLANGRRHMALPGPSIMPDRVLQAMHQGAPDIYTTDLRDQVAEMVLDLKYIARTEAHVAIYISNGHGAWEAAMANTLSAGDKVLVPATGHFGLEWAQVARGQGLEVQLLDHGRQSPMDPERIRDVLKTDAAHEIKAVLAVHVDTASSVRSDIAALRRVLDDLGHPALLMVDCIASLGADEFQMDAWGADIMVAGSQKGLMVPPGLGFVFFNDRAHALRQSKECVPFYWDWTARIAPEALWQYFGGTAPTHHLFGLRAALDMIREEGIENIWARHKTLAQSVWAAVEHWGAPMALNIADPAVRSHAVTAVSIGAPDGDRLRDWVRDEAGVTLGFGLGAWSDADPTASGAFRFGHMGHINAHSTLGMLGAVEAGLVALGIPHVSGGVSAAAQVIAKG